MTVYAMTRMKWLGVFIYVSFLYICCVPPGTRNAEDIVVDFSDETHQLIVDLQDRKSIDSLLIFLDSGDATERYLAAQAFASVRDAAGLEKLGILLIDDPSEEVREQVAYAIGQIGEPSSEKVLIEAFNIPEDEVNTPLKAAILEAVGKVGSEESLNFISSVTSYTRSDDQLLLGQARSIYRFGLRGLTSDIAKKTMLTTLLNKDIPAAPRKIAGKYLSRFGVSIKDVKSRLGALLLTEDDPEVRVSVASILGQSGDVEVMPKILASLQQDDDYRVKANVLRQLGNYNYYTYRDTVLSLIEAENETVALVAMELLKAAGDRRDAGDLLTKARSLNNPRRKAALLSAALNTLPSNYINTRKAINTELTNGLRAVSGTYDKIEFIKGLALDPLNYATFRDEGLFSTNNVIQTVAINAIPSFLTNIRTQRIYRNEALYKDLKQTIVNDLMKAAEGNDIGVLASIGSVLKSEELDFRDQVDSTVVIRSFIDELDMPGDIETYNELVGAMEYLDDTTYQNLKVELGYNHPIEWSNLENISDSSRAFIITTRGQIEIKLYTSSAPGTVANFIDLASDNYYDGKVIHRVVPNFVIQGGCPRGDGYGGLGYTIRSEVSQHYYDEGGYIGMASAGPDTEGTQWFITHSAAPHLDGRYTIFGKVASGMDVVHDIQVGDVIQDVRILKF